jgi:hypothetical protein
MSTMPSRTAARLGSRRSGSRRISPKARERTQPSASAFPLKGPWEGRLSWRPRHKGEVSRSMLWDGSRAWVR